MKRIRNGLFTATFLICCLSLQAQVPQIINYQGRVVVGTTNFNGTGSFKFALVNAVGTTTYWSNNNSSVNGSEPTAAVSLSVSKGLYSVLLGDTSLTNMTAIPAAVFNNSDVRLRVWFNDGTTGSQLLAPDQRIVSVGYAVLAANVPDLAITTAKIANGAVNSSKIDSTTVQQRVTGTAPGGSFITGINQNGSVTTAPGGGGVWSLNGTFAYYTGGNVGIGTSTAPATSPGKLTVQSTTTNYGLEHTDGSIRLATFVGGSTGGGWLGTVSTSPLSFFVSNGGASMTINTDSTIDVGTPVPSTLSGRLTVNAAASDTFPFYVKDSGGYDVFRLSVGSPPSLQMFGNASKSSGGTSWGIISDQRVKQDVRAFEPGLNEVVRLRPVRFHYRDDIQRGLSSGQEEVGFIAQEVREVIADAVAEGADGYLTLKADPIHWAGINAIQELNRKVEEQRAENAELKQRLANLEQQMNRNDVDAE